MTCLLNPFFPRLKSICPVSSHIRRKHIEAKDAQEISVPIPYGNIAGWLQQLLVRVLHYNNNALLVDAYTLFKYRKTMGKSRWQSHHMVYNYLSLTTYIVSAY